MIRYLVNKDIEREKWDACVENSCFETIYPYSWYLDLVSPGWDGLVMRDYEAVFPLTWKKKYGIYYVIQPVLSQQLGVFSPAMPSAIEVQFFLERIPEKFRHMDICLNSSNEIRGRDFKILKRVNYELEVNREIRDIEAQYSTNAKRNIKKAINEQLAIENIDVESYIRLRRDSDTSIFKKGHYDWLKALFSGIMDRGKGEIFGAFSNGKLCAAVIWAFSKTRHIYLNAVSDEAGKENRAMFLLVDHYIHKSAGKNIKLDFEGSMIPGIARFFEGFGASKMNYARIIKSAFPLNLKKAVK